MNKLFILLLLAFAAVTSAVDVTLQDVRNDLAAARRDYAAAGLSPDPSAYSAGISLVLNGLQQVRSQAPTGTDMNALDIESAALRAEVVSTDVAELSITQDVTGIQSQLDLATNVNEQITADLIAAAWTVTESMLPAKVAAASVTAGNSASSGSPTLQRAMFGPVTTLMERNALLPAGSAHLENARRGLNVIASIYDTISVHPSYLGDGASVDPYKETYSYKTANSGFTSRINRFNVPWTIEGVDNADIMFNVEVGPESMETVPGQVAQAMVPKSKADIRIQAGAFDLFLASAKYPEKRVDMTYWMAKPNFISDAVSAPFAQRILSDSGVNVKLTAMTVARRREEVEKSLDMTVSVLLTYPAEMCNLEMTDQCRPRCMLWNDELNDYTADGVLTEDGPTDGTVRCGLGRGGLVVVIAEDLRKPVPPGATRVRIYIPDIPVTTTPEEKTQWEKDATDDVNGAVHQDLDLQNIYSETGNAANGGIATFMDIMKPDLEDCSDCTRNNGKERWTSSYEVYEQIESQSRIPTSKFRSAENRVGSQTDEFSVTMFCEDTEQYEKSCAVDRSVSDDSDTEAVMIIAIIAGCVFFLAAVVGYFKYCRKGDKDVATGAETEAMV